MIWNLGKSTQQSNPAEYPLVITECHEHFIVKPELQNWKRKPNKSAWWAAQEGVTGISSMQYYYTAALPFLE